MNRIAPNFIVIDFKTALSLMIAKRQIRREVVGSGWQTFYEGPASQCFLLCEAVVSPSRLLKCLCGVKAALDNPETDGQDRVWHVSLPAAVCHSLI